MTIPISPAGSGKVPGSTRPALTRPGFTRPGFTRRAFIAGVEASAIACLPAVRAMALDVASGTVTGKAGWLFLVWDDPRRVDFRKMDQVIGVIGGAVGILKHAGIDVVIALTPAKARVYREFLPDDFAFTPDSERRYAVAVETLRRSGALVPDLAGTFAGLRQSQPGAMIFFQTDTHWAAEGAECAAAEVGRQMKAALHLPTVGKPGAKLGPSVRVMHAQGDLAKNLPANLRAEHPPEAYQMRQVQAATGHADLLDEDTADVVVIGNSYMQPKYNFAPALSAALDRPVSLVWKVHLVGPYRTLLTYLGSDAFRQRRPKAIVWNFHEIDMEIMPDSQAAWPEDAMADDVFLAGVRKAVGA